MSGTEAKLGEPEDVGFVSTADGSIQKYVRMMPRTPAGRAADSALICLHGHGSDRWQYVRDERGECRGAREVAARHGLLFISPDYRATASWMGPAAEADLTQIIADLRASHGISRILLAGASMGGTSALIFTALHPRLIDGVCAENGTADMLGYGNFADAIAESYGGTKTEKPEEYRLRSAELVPERFIMPIALTVGGMDDVVPPHSFRRLAASLTQARQRVLMIDRPATGHETDLQDTIACLEFIVAESANPR